MGFLEWLSSKVGGGKSVSVSGDEIDDFLQEYTSTICIREAAFWTAANILANALSKCEFKTYVKGDEKKGSEYYLWNYEPNKNQNSSVFLHKLIAKLCRDNECLVICIGEQLLVADSYTKNEKVLFENTFTEVTVGDFSFQKTFYQADVLFFELNNKNMRQVVNDLYGEYEKLIQYSINAYQKSRGRKFLFEYDTLPVAGSEERKNFDDLIKNKFKKFIESDNAVLPLGKGQKVDETAQKTYAAETTRDIRAMIDDISDFTAKGFGIHPSLLSGDVQGTKDALDFTLTFAVDPLVDMIQEEIIRKRYGYKAFSEGTYLKIDTRAIKHIDLFSISTSIDKLIGSGVFCVNDILQLCGENSIDEPWAKQHFITKNYELVEDALRALKGGEKNEDNLET